MKATSRMTKDFAMKSKLRHMADGGEYSAFQAKRPMLDSAGMSEANRAVGEGLRAANEGASVASAFLSQIPRQPPGVRAQELEVPELADGGLIGTATSAIAQRRALLDNPGAAPVAAPAPAPVAAPAPAPAPVAAMSPEELALRQKYGVGQPKPSTGLRKLFGLADGGYAVVPQGDVPHQRPPSKGKIAPVTGKPIPPQPTPPTPMPIMGVRAANGGHVRGPGGPREDKVGPVMLSDGEYVLPAKTVDKLGGPAKLDKIVKATNDGRPPLGDDVGMADGGIIDSLRGFGSKVGGMFSSAPSPSVTKVDLDPTKFAGKVDFDPTRVSGAARAGNVLRASVPAAALGYSLDSSLETYRTPTDVYEKRFGFEPNTTPGALGFARDLGVRALGAVSDFANPGNILGYAHKPPAAEASPAAAPTQPESPAGKPIPAPAGAVSSILREGVGSPGGQAFDLGANIAVRPGANGRYNDFSNADGQSNRLTNTVTGFRDAPGKLNDSVNAALAGGDLEAANRLATTPAQRAAVDAAYAAGKQRRYDEASRAVDRNRINDRYDDWVRESNMGKGNTGRRMVELRRAQAGELLAQERNFSDQDINSGKISALRAGQEASAKSDALKLGLDQANKDRQFALDSAKFGVESARVMQNDRDAKTKAVYDDIDKIGGGLFVMPDAKGNLVPNPAVREAFNTFLFSRNPNLASLSAGERRAVIEDAREKFVIQQRVNAAGGGFNEKTFSTPQPISAPREVEMGDILRGMGPGTYAGSKIREWVGQRPDTYDIGTGGNMQSRAGRDLYGEGSADSAEKISRLRREP